MFKKFCFSLVLFKQKKKTPLSLSQNGSVIDAARLTEAHWIDMRLKHFRACVDDCCRAYANIHTAQSTHAGSWSSGTGTPHRSPRPHTST